MELRQYAAVIWRWLWLIVACSVVAALFSWLAVKDQPSVYATSTTLMIGQVIDNPNPTYSDFYTGERLAQTYSELIKREPILRETAAALGFEERWPALRGQISVSLVPGTQLMEIRVSDTDPVRAKRIADEVTRQLQLRVTPDDTPEREFIRSQAATFPAKVEAAQDEIKKLEAELSEVFSARQIQDIQNQINVLQNQISTWQATFAQYQLLLGEYGAKVLEVIEEAPEPTSPVSANWYMQVLLAAAIGAALGVAAAFLLEYLDDSLKSPADVTKATGLATIGVVGRIGGTREEKLVTLRHPKSPISEAYRLLRTNLQFASVDDPLKVLVVTSAQPEEGKSTTLANLGVVLAQDGKSVLLVDSDLRRPVLHKIFELPNKGGLTTVLVGEDLKLEGRVQSTSMELLDVLSSGPLPPNPSELLGSQKMHQLLDLLRETYDVVLLDSPPVLLVTDAGVLGPAVDGVLLVASPGRTRRAAAKRAVETLQHVGANLLGIVVNRQAARGAGAYYTYAYYYQYDQEGGGRRRRGGKWYQRILQPFSRS